LSTQRSLEMSGTIYLATQRHISEDLNLQQSRCENFSLANTENINATFKNNFDIIYTNGTNNVHRYIKINLYAKGTPLGFGQSCDQLQ
jgi:hypothetical protein